MWTWIRANASLPIRLYLIGVNAYSESKSFAIEVEAAR
jgi:hypothetical protein